MSNTIESRTEIQVDVPLLEEAKMLCVSEMLDAMNGISIALSDMKEFKKEKDEEMDKCVATISNTQSKANDSHISKETRMLLGTEIVELMSTMNHIGQELHTYMTQKKAEVAKLEEVKNIAQMKISRGRDFQRVEVKLLKDYDKKIKTFIDLKTGEIIKKLPMTDDDLQMPLAE